MRGQLGELKHIVIILPEQPNFLAQKAVELADTVVSVGQPGTWLLAGDLEQDIWVAAGSEADLWRTVRRLTYRSVGLALSSGGSRGLAHIGTLKVLLEEGIPVDMIAGSSIGAWFGALFATGWDVGRYDQLVEDIMKQIGRFSNWDINIPPLTGFIKGRKLHRFITRSLEVRNFEDLRIPLYVVAADIITGDEVIFDSGDLADPIRASNGIPALVDAWYCQGHHLVDGGIVNPLPASVLRDHGADIIIGSSVIQPLNEADSRNTGRRPSILQALLNMFGVMEVQMTLKQLPLVDILIQHQLPPRQRLDFRNGMEIVRIGEETARQLVPVIKKGIDNPIEINDKIWA